MGYRGPGRELAALIAEQADEMGREGITESEPHGRRGFRLARHRGEVRLSELPTEAREEVEEGGSARWRARRVGSPRQWAVYLVGCDPHQWDAAAHLSSALIFDPEDPHAADHLLAHFRERSQPIRCPVCLDRPLPRGWYCLACDRAGLDPLAESDRHEFEYDGYDVDEIPEWDYRNAYKLSFTSYAPDPSGRLGGLGTRPD